MTYSSDLTKGNVFRMCKGGIFIKGVVQHNIRETARNAKFTTELAAANSEMNSYIDLKVS